MRRTYIALTTTNPQGGWEFLGVAETRDAANAFLPEIDEASNLYAQTRYLNFRVVTKTEARRFLGREGAAWAAQGIDPREAQNA